MKLDRCSVVVAVMIDERGQRRLRIGPDAGRDASTLAHARIASICGDDQGCLKAPTVLEPHTCVILSKISALRACANKGQTRGRRGSVCQSLDQHVSTFHPNASSPISYQRPSVLT